MKRTQGRNLFVTDFSKVSEASDPDALANKCEDAHLAAVWIRIGRGRTRDANLVHPKLKAFRTALRSLGIELWGWHVPFCADKSAAAAEASKVLSWTDNAQLAGIVVDAERTPENPRFRGGETEAVAYLGPLRKGLEAAGRGIAFSSHDQPSLHTNMPFRPFLDYIEDVCPQVYYSSADPEARLNKSIRDYKALITDETFTSRYKPTGNITIGGDVGFSDSAVCVTATSKFLRLIETAGFTSYSFWCWDSAPGEVWPLLAANRAVQSDSRSSQIKGEVMKLDAAQQQLNIVQDFVPVGNSNRPGTKLAASSITIHNTDNTAPRANAAAHARYMKGPDAQKRQVSWHYTVDDKSVYQSLPTNEIGWHTATKQGNASSIGIEICMNSDLDVAACYDRAALLTAWVAYRLGIQVPSGIFQHHDWSGKNCPIVLRSTARGWADFLAKVQNYYRSLEPVDAPLISHNDGDHHDEPVA